MDGDRVVWEDFGLFTEADVHHQYAIALKTPPYRRTNIEESVSIHFALKFDKNEFMNEFYAGQYLGESIYSTVSTT